MATERGEVSPKLEMEEAKGMGGESNGRGEVSPRISTSELEIEEAKEMGGEANGRGELPPKLEMEEAKGMGDEKFFDLYWRVLESNWSSLFSSPTTDTTSLSSMHFTHSTTGCTPYAAFAGTTLQMYSIKVTEIKEALGLEWPLHVYGMVAARDTVDGDHNIIFLRRRNDYQILTEKDPCLHLIGPSRAIVAIDHVDFDIELKVKGRTWAEDRVLMSRTFKYSSIYCYSPTTLFSDFCQIALQFEKLEKTVQATIVGVRVTERRRPWPFKHGGRVTCVAKGFSEPGELQGRVTEPDVPKDKRKLPEEVVLQDQVMANRSDGYVDLSRHVVSVELGGMLEVIIREWSESHPFIKHQVRVFFKAQECKISRETCYLGHSKVEVTVAWSLLVRDKRSISREGCVEIEEAKEMGGESNGRDEVSPRISSSELEIEEANEMGGESNGRDEVSPRISTSELEKPSYKETVRAEIYSFLNLITKNVMKLKAESKLRISYYSSNEIRIHMDNMHSEVTNLLQMMENQPARIFDFLLKSILNRLELIHTLVSKSISEEAKETGGEAKGRDEVSPRIFTFIDPKLGMEEAKAMREEAIRKVLTEEESFARYRYDWVSSWSATRGTFTETTTLSPMYFTHSTPGHSPLAAFVGSTLQMYSIKVAEIKGALGLQWPLRVYGVVAARDTVDRNRNILFSRQRDDYQELKQQDPFLRLTGPSRAIVSKEPVDVEIELKVKGRTKSEDRVLISDVWYYSGMSCPLYAPCSRKFCTLVLSSEELKKSVQATIVGVRLTEGSPWPFEYGGRVVCSSLPRKGRFPDSKHITAPSCRQVVLEDGAMDVCANGYLGLSRNVVSVELCGRLEVLIYAYSESRDIAAHGRVSIKAQFCDVTQDICRLGDSELQITVAWSRLVRDKGYISNEISIGF